MKKILLIAFLLSSLISFGQDTTKVNIGLALKYHAYIIGSMPKDVTVDKMKYINQVASAMVLPIDSNQVISVRVTNDLVAELYVSIGNQPERVSSDYNQNIKAALLPQILNDPALLQKIQSVAIANTNDTNRLLNGGFQYLKALKSN